jgi:predicted permease
MFASVAIVLPVFGLIGIGYLARQIALVSDRTGEGLSDFVFALAVPCLIFRTLVRAEIPDVQPWGYWISYFTGVAVVWGLAMILGRRFIGLTGTPSSWASR